MSHSHCCFGIRPLALAIGLGLLSMGSSAQTQAQVSAQASYSLAGGKTVLLADPGGGTPGGTVDVLSFPYDYLTGSVAGLHTYGDQSGNFGSRSSGSGHYDVTGLFSLTRVVTNTSAIDQRAAFNFYIAPGVLQNDVRSDLSGDGYHVASGIKFNVRRDGGSVWSSEASLRSDASGSSYSQTGSDIYTQAGARTYAVDGGTYTVDLGVINAGESITVQYDLSTFAHGMARGAGEFYVPIETVNVPEQRIFHPASWYVQWVYDEGNGGYGGYGGYGGHYQTVTEPAHTEVIPAHTVQTGGFTVWSEGSGSYASSGDPFYIAWTGRVYNFYGSDGKVLRASSSPYEIVMIPGVPEAQSYAMALAGGVVTGLVAKRRRRRT